VNPDRDTRSASFYSLRLAEPHRSLWKVLSSSITPEVNIDRSWIVPQQAQIF